MVQYEGGFTQGQCLAACSFMAYGSEQKPFFNGTYVLPNTRSIPMIDT